MNMPIEHLMGRLATIVEYKSLFADSIPGRRHVSGDARRSDRYL